MARTSVQHKYVSRFKGIGMRRGSFFCLVSAKQEFINTKNAKTWSKGTRLCKLFGDQVDVIVQS
ncbi:hypothetical protein CEN39_24120 [Fischerella thermalis CCMEE 5201]|nr:hypothetical protein CEN39_24120 [Fischerella thermalis CCMEE 5201]